MAMLKVGREVRLAPGWAACLEAGREAKREAGLETGWPGSGEAMVGCPRLWFFLGCPCPSP